MIMRHPRLLHCPHHEDYTALANEFRPFVMFTHTPYYRSKSVNTDKFGLRVQSDAEGAFLDLERIADRYEDCNVIVGGSTVFGVDSTSDAHTIPHRLSSKTTPCLNFGVRGATSQQEVFLFLSLKRFLPAVKNIVLFSGVNNISLASLDDTVFYPEFGGIFSEEFHYACYRDQYRALGASNRALAKIAFHERLDRFYDRYRFVRWIVDTFHHPKPWDHTRKATLTFDEKLALMAKLFDNDLSIWKSVGEAHDCKVHFVLQPVLTWTNRAPTRREKAFFRADVRDVPSLGTYTSRSVYGDYRASVEAACGKHEIAFHDANEWIANPTCSDVEVFTDLCHLTDEGVDVVVDGLRASLDWKE